MQQTDFPFVAVVHDDASTDGTASIIREYAEKYPDIILPIYETENQYSKHDGSLGRIMAEAHGATMAKYIAECEGDDYWTDPCKLQKQVDFLESHSDCSLCFSNARTLMLDGTINDSLFAISGSRYYTPKEIIKKWTIPTASVVYRKSSIKKYEKNPKFKYGDNVLFLNAARYGGLYGIDEYMGVYRKQPNSMTNSVGPIRWAEINIEHLKALKESFNDLFNDDTLDEVIADQYIYLIRRNRQSISNMAKLVLKALVDVPSSFLKLGIENWILRIK
jgi:glycosyltransferase involved in cell wall biosynthesis